VARFVRLVLLLGVLGVVGAAAGLLWLVRMPHTPREPVLVDIVRGTGSRAIARTLARQDVVASQWHFLAVRVLRPREVLQAGEYEFKGPASAWDVFAKMARGEVYYRELTIREGSNLFDIANLLEQEGMIGGAAFRKAAQNTKLVHDLAPDTPSLEGYLFPATYRITKQTTAEQLVREMTDRFRRAWKEAAGADAARRVPVHRVVTLASLVEKETGQGDERTMVASVFQNRLDRGMKLECDPTTIYAALLEGRYRGTIYRSDLNSLNRYNTYQHAGLPPGPIANPGLASLQAALRPADSDYLFFVARPDGSGGHIFSRTLDEHNEAVIRYRRGQQQQKSNP
jgi:UPF0755 protein